VKITLSPPRRHLPACHGAELRVVVPKEAVDEAGADFGKKPVGTGAFKLEEWTLGQRLVFEKNADYWREGVPFSTDHLRGRPGTRRGLLRLQNGEVDVPGDGIPPAKFIEVMADPPGGARRRGRPASHRLHHPERHIPPFDNVRCARPSTWRSTRTASPRSSTAARCPPPSRCRPRCPATPKATPATPTTRRRQGAAGRGGLADGFETELFVMNTDPNPRIAQAIQQDLAAIGITANIQSSPRPT
jgi:ABC-type transport system substrate-binding protein